MRTKGICSVPGCGRPVKQKGLCAAHDARLYRHGDVDAGTPVVRRGGLFARCTAPCDPPCPRPVYGLGLCKPHYYRLVQTPGADLTRPVGVKAEPKPRPPCSVACCDRPSKVRGYCSAHYQRLMKGRYMDAPVLPSRCGGRLP